MPWTVAHQAPLFMEISWQEYLSGLPFLPPGDQTHLSCGFCFGKQILYHWDFLNICAQFSSAQSLSHVWLFVTSLTAACQASLSITNSRSLLKLMSIELVMPSNHLILCHPFSSPLQSFPASGFFKWVSSSHQLAKVLEFQLQHQSFRWTPRTNLFAVQGTLKSLLQCHSSKASILRCSGVCSPTLTSIHDYWKKHTFD